MKKCNHKNCKPCTFDNYELDDREFLYTFLRQFSDSTLIDIGAHVGLYGHSIHQMLAVDQHLTGKLHRCKIISIEPDNRVFRALLDNVGESNTWQCAAWDSNADLWWTSGNGRPHGHMLADRAPDLDCTKTKGHPLDKLVGSTPDVIALKIDTEGSECRVLTGARSLIQQASYVAMVIEMSTDHLKSYGDAPEDILELCNLAKLTAVDNRQLTDIDNGFKRNVRFVKGYTP